MNKSFKKKKEKKAIASKYLLNHMNDNAIKKQTKTKKCPQGKLRNWIKPSKTIISTFWKLTKGKII